MMRYGLLFAACFGATVALANDDLDVQPQPGTLIEGSRDALVTMNSLFGPSGLIAVPTAYTVGLNTATFGASFGRNVRVPSINYGLFEFVEIGGAFVDREGADNKAIANAKVTLIPANFENFEVGIGVIDALEAIDQTFYFVGSADLLPPDAQIADRGLQAVRVHAGVGTGSFEERLIGGVELVFQGGFALVGEYDASNFNAAVRYAHDERFALQLGFQSTEFFLGATSTLRF